MLLQHITLLTGDSVTHRLDTISPEAIAACAALLPNGGPVPGFPAFRVQITGTVFNIFRGRDPLVICAVGTSQSGNDLVMWDVVKNLQERFAPCKVTLPPRGAWLAVALLPGLATTTQQDIGWLADFELCMAAAILQ